MFTYDSKTFTGWTEYEIPDIDEETLSNSLIYAYYKPENNNFYWAPVTGIGWYGKYNIESWITFLEDYYAYSVSLYNPGTITAYPTSVTWYGFKIIIVPIPADNITEVKGAPVDFSNYAEVAAYYGLPE
jgi:hypothetical protein